MDTTRLNNSDGSEPPRCNLQEVDWRPLLGLKLAKSQALTSLLQARLRRAAAAGDHNHDLPRPNVGSQLHQPIKASNFPINTISIGPWKRVSRHEGELTAKLYFAKRKLVWEFLEGQLKSKIEVLWSDITAIKALMPPHQPGTLQIELGKPPLFFKEIKPQPRKHTNWQQAPDFTQGHAPLYRRHYATFPPGVLDRHYEKLVQCDQHLFQLSRNPFPTHQDLPFFNTSAAAQQMPFNNEQPLIPLNPIRTAVNFPHMVESPRNNDDDHHHIGMNMNYFHEEASFLHSFIPPHHGYNYNHDQSPAVDVINPQFNQIQIHDNLMTVPNYNTYADIWLPPTPTLEGSNNCINDLPPPNLDLDDHINNLGGYGNHHHHHRQY